jgi:hypothetical protein
MVALKWMKYMDCNISNIHSNPEIHTTPHNAHTGNRILTFKIVCWQQFCDSLPHKPAYKAIIKHRGYYYANKNMLTEYTYSQMSDKYDNTKTKMLFKLEDKICHQNW